ncbi:hypothetical protein ACFT5C_33000 [Streptomyces sp. NPDC057116]|uniref:hypothetical protein n=1 Tax=Streptomyces sp. NPDC057116 TaxID=3346023 RepID=UPI00363B0A6A
MTETVLDPATHDWVRDHCPTWTVPALPLMSMADLIARAATRYAGRTATGLRDLQVRRWLPLPGPTSLRLTCEGSAARPQVTLSAWLELREARLSRFAPVACATAVFDVLPPPRRFAPLEHTVPMADPYESGDCFHGPRFQYLRSARAGEGGASGVLHPGRGSVPPGLLHQGLLDAATHIIPHTRMWQWSPSINRASVTYPHRLSRLHTYGPLPGTGLIEVEARFAGFHTGDARLPAVDLQLCVAERVLTDARLVLVLLPVGPLLDMPPHLRRDYLRDRRYVPGLLLSTAHDATTVLRHDDVRQLDFFPGTAASLYQLPAGLSLRDSTPLIAAKEHVARRTATHPCRITVADDLRTAHTDEAPHLPYALDVTLAADHVHVRDRPAADHSPEEEGS